MSGFSKCPKFHSSLPSLLSWPSTRLRCQLCFLPESQVCRHQIPCEPVYCGFTTGVSAFLLVLLLCCCCWLNLVARCAASAAKAPDAIFSWACNRIREARAQAEAACAYRLSVERFLKQPAVQTVWSGLAWPLHSCSRSREPVSFAMLPGSHRLRPKRSQREAWRQQRGAAD